MLHVVTVVAVEGLGVGQRVGGDWVGGEAWGTYGKSRGTRPGMLLHKVLRLSVLYIEVER